MSQPMVTVWNLPAGTDSEYAIRQQAYDRQVAEGMWTVDGRLEAVVSQAATVPSAVQQLPQWTVLFGLQIRTSIAEFAYRPDWDLMRSRSIFEAPSLGSLQKRAADRQKIQDRLATLGRNLSADDELAALRIMAAIEQTEEDNRQVLYARNQMGSVVAG